MTKKVDAVTYSDYHFAAEAALEEALKEDRKHHAEKPAERLKGAIKTFLESYDRQKEELKAANA